MSSACSRALVGVTAAVGLTTALATQLRAAEPNSPSLPATHTPTAEWMSPRVPLTEPFPGTAGLSAKSCGACHPDIYAEWQTSTHAHAWVDPQFQAELHKDPEVAWLCINCHTPLAAQQEVLRTHTGDVRHPSEVENDAFDEALQQEGITCLTCHWRPEGIASIHPEANAPHPLVHDPTLRAETTCTVCHQAVARLEDALVCTFNTGQEWQEAQPGKTCPECHMPKVERSHAIGAPSRTGGRHTWPGSLVPKDTPTDDERRLMALDWEAGVDLSLQAPEGAAVGTATTVGLRVTNARAGHRVPTGDPERYLDVQLVVRDSAGTPLATESARIGQVWEWWPVAKRLSDNRLAPGESTTVTAQVEMPPGGLQIEAWLDHVRISPENAGYHDLGDYPTRRRVHTRSARVAPTASPP